MQSMKPTPKHILVIDDEVGITDSLAEIFCEEGYLVDVANHGGEAVSKGSRSQYDVILCDISMPDMSGIETVKRIQAGINAKTPVIYLSGSFDLTVFIKAQAMTPFAFLHKPFDIEILTEMVRQAADGKSPGEKGTDRT